MANEEQLAILKQGVAIWNKWRQKNPTDIQPDLEGANLTGADLRRANLQAANLTRAHIGYTIFADNDLGSVQGPARSHQAARRHRSEDGRTLARRQAHRRARRHPRGRPRHSRDQHPLARRPSAATRLRARGLRRAVGRPAHAQCPHHGQHQTDALRLRRHFPAPLARRPPPVRHDAPAARYRCHGDGVWREEQLWLHACLVAIGSQRKA